MKTEIGVRLGLVYLISAFSILLRGFMSVGYEGCAGCDEGGSSWAVCESGASSPQRHYYFSSHMYQTHGEKKIRTQFNSLDFTSLLFPRLPTVYQRVYLLVVPLW